MAGIDDGAQVYFTHSYAAPVIDDTAASCEYGVPFSAAVERDNVSAVQFHPGEVRRHRPAHPEQLAHADLSRRSSEGA